MSIRKYHRNLKKKAMQNNLPEIKSHINRAQNLVDVRYQEQDTERDMLMFSFVMAMACKVLCDEFGFGKLPKDKEATEKFRLVRFARAVSDQIDAFDSTRKDAVESYCNRIYRDYGVKFVYK